MVILYLPLMTFLKLPNDYACAYRIGPDVLEMYRAGLSPEVLTSTPLTSLS
jgi:hypothetical protein